MPGRTNGAPPHILCTCKETTTVPVAVNLPPVGTETMCLFCGRIWALDAYHGDRWSWTAEDPPEDAGVRAATYGGLVSQLLGVDVKLMLAMGMARADRGLVAEGVC